MQKKGEKKKRRSKCFFEEVSICEVGTDKTERAKEK